MDAAFTPFTPFAPFDPVATARLALACLDLTSLNDVDTPADIDRLCARALGLDPARGATAAVCVWPRFVAQARGLLPVSIAVAAVANFPDGSADAARAVADTRAIVEAGGDEVDVVFPYRDAPDFSAAARLLNVVRSACLGRRLKVILETGETQDSTRIAQACRIALDAGADFLKTSTGKTPVSATPEAARVLLQAIAADPLTRHRVGFKPSGGIRTVADAALYIGLTREILGDAALTPARLRIGASGLLNDIEAVLSGADRPDLATTTY
jgi:deoxyribose-phosphate aldolase